MLGHLELILASFAGGAAVFFVVFWVQAVRNRAILVIDEDSSSIIDANRAAAAEPLASG